MFLKLKTISIFIRKKVFWSFEKGWFPPKYLSGAASIQCLRFINKLKVLNNLKLILTLMRRCSCYF